MSDFGLIWRHFRKNLQIKNFFQKSGSLTFLRLCKKSQKSLEPASQPASQPTNQPTNQPTDQLTNHPTNQLLQHLFYRAWLTPAQKHKNYKYGREIMKNLVKHKIRNVLHFYLKH